MGEETCVDDLCIGNTCSGQGYCIDSISGLCDCMAPFSPVAPGVCSCEEGEIYNPNNNQCVPDLCIGNDCSNHGTCDPFVTGACTCDRTFIPVGNNVCRCESNKIVSSRGICECEQGKVWDSTTNKCVNYCSGNCGGHGSCDPGSGICTCDPTFVIVDTNVCGCPSGLIESKTGDCIDLCDGIDCGGHGSCQASDGSCVCDETFVKISPNDCACSSDTVYDSESNQCVDLCEGNDCGQNGSCNTASGICECDAGFELDESENTCVALPCGDDSTYTFPLDNVQDFEGSCAWISMNDKRIDTRRLNYCYQDAECKVPTETGNHCQASCGFCDGGNLSTCSTQEATEATTCSNIGSFKFELTKTGDLKHCSWLTKNAANVDTRRNNYCNQTHVGAACQKSCAKCNMYADNPNFTFERKKKDKNGKIVMLDCAWITQNQKAVETRRDTYCFVDCNKASDVGDACPVACGFTEGLHWNKTCK